MYFKALFRDSGSAISRLLDNNLDKKDKPSIIYLYIYEMDYIYIYIFSWNKFRTFSIGYLI